MWIVACNLGDDAALWAARRLRAAGLEPLELVGAEALAYALRFEHRLGDGTAAVRIELADGRILDSTQVHGVLNRIAYVPTEHLALASEGDRAYAAQEISALFLSWLSALPGPVLNRPTPFGMAGPYLDSTHWLALAAQAGLPTPAARLSSSRLKAEARLPASEQSVVVACGKVHGAVLPDPMAASCLRLAALSGADILGIELGKEADGTRVFAGATAVPDLRAGDAGLIDGLIGGLAGAGSR